MPTVKKTGKVRAINWHLFDPLIFEEDKAIPLISYDFIKKELTAPFLVKEQSLDGLLANLAFQDAPEVLSELSEFFAEAAKIAEEDYE